MNTPDQILVLLVIGSIVVTYWFYWTFKKKTELKFRYLKIKFKKSQKNVIENTTIHVFVSGRKKGLK